jgi:hypothetical protein
MKKYRVEICANIARRAFEVEAQTEVAAREKAYELWEQSKIEELDRYDIADVEVFEVKK